MRSRRIHSLGAGPSGAWLPALALTLLLAPALRAGPAATFQRALPPPPSDRDLSPGYADTEGALRRALDALVAIEEQQPDALPREQAATLALLQDTVRALRYQGRPPRLPAGGITDWVVSTSDETPPGFVELRRRVLRLLRTLPLRGDRDAWDGTLALVEAPEEELQAGLDHARRLVRYLKLGWLLSSLWLVLFVAYLASDRLPDGLRALLRGLLARLGHPLPTLLILFVMVCLVFPLSVFMISFELGSAALLLTAARRVRQQELAVRTGASEPQEPGQATVPGVDRTGPTPAIACRLDDSCGIRFDRVEAGSSESVAGVSDALDSVPLPPTYDDLVQEIRGRLPEGRYGEPEHLGHGGMGAVFRMEDRDLGRPVALELMQPFAAREEASRARFLREARALAALVHPRLPAVHDVGRSPVPYLLMECIEGRSLKQVYEQSSPSPAIVRDWLIQAADALAHAHDKGVIHRDVKPDNLMLDAQQRVRVIDFGLARMDQEEIGTAITQAGVGMGTPAYMPPEQFRGEEPTARNDVYSLAATGYFLLSGRYPYTMPQLSAGHGFDPTPLSEAVPADLEACLARALSLRAEDRPADMREFFEELRACG